MSIVSESIDFFPFEAPPLVLQRREDLLLAEPLPMKMKLMRDHPLIEAAHFPTHYVDQPFAPPVGVYESDAIRIEWQNMQGRQPFYHRNCGVDEISFQVCGERTLITELGTLELRAGDFSRIPNGVAHDNFGRKDVHLLFYVPGPTPELTAARRQSEDKAVPFPGWEPALINELVTEGVGGPGNDLILAPVAEELLIQQAKHTPQRIPVPQTAEQGLTWLYRGPAVTLGHCALSANTGTRYTRHRDAHEIQYQIQGERLLVTQRGVLKLEPGDFVQIPKGIAFTSIHAFPSEHLAFASLCALPRVAPLARQGKKMSHAEVEAWRQQAFASTAGRQA
ncbi:MAG: hypothetical protein M0Q54_01385 [Pigmentiphaga sp.]|nr:hypothetical protein [Pigmentiphaga sp.]